MKTLTPKQRSWIETHHEIVVLIQQHQDKPLIKAIQFDSGRCGLWELAIRWTHEFQGKNENREWDGEFFEEIDEFVESKLKP